MYLIHVAFMNARDTNLCGASVRPTYERSLVRGGGGYNQGSDVYFAKGSGGWVFAGVNRVVCVDDGGCGPTVGVGCLRVFQWRDLCGLSVEDSSVLSQQAVYSQNRDGYEV